MQRQRYRVLEAYLQTDGRMRVTLSVTGRERPLTFWVPANDYVDAPGEERGIDLDDGMEDSAARFIMDGYASAVVMNWEHGGIDDSVEEHHQKEDASGVVLCYVSPYQRQRRRRLA